MVKSSKGFDALLDAARSIEGARGFLRIRGGWKFAAGNLTYEVRRDAHGVTYSHPADHAARFRTRAPFDHTLERTLQAFTGACATAMEWFRRVERTFKLRWELGRPILFGTDISVEALVDGFVPVLEVMVYENGLLRARMRERFDGVDDAIAFLDAHGVERRRPSAVTEAAAPLLARLADALVAEGLAEWLDGDPAHPLENRPNALTLALRCEHGAVRAVVGMRDTPRGRFMVIRLRVPDLDDEVLATFMPAPRERHRDMARRFFATCMAFIGGTVANHSAAHAVFGARFMFGLSTVRGDLTVSRGDESIAHVAVDVEDVDRITYIVLFNRGSEPTARFDDPREAWEHVLARISGRETAFEAKRHMNPIDRLAAALASTGMGGAISDIELWFYADDGTRVTVRVTNRTSMSGFMLGLFMDGVDPAIRGSLHLGFRWDASEDDRQLARRFVATASTAIVAEQRFYASMQRALDRLREVDGRWTLRRGPSCVLKLRNQTTVDAVDAHTRVTSPDKCAYVVIMEDGVREFDDPEDACAFIVDHLTGPLTEARRFTAADVAAIAKMACAELGIGSDGMVVLDRGKSSVTFVSFDHAGMKFWLSESQDGSMLRAHASLPGDGNASLSSALIRTRGRDAARALVGFIDLAVHARDALQEILDGLSPYGYIRRESFIVPRSSPSHRAPHARVWVDGFEVHVGTSADVPTTFNTGLYTIRGSASEAIDWIVSELDRTNETASPQRRMLRSLVEAEGWGARCRAAIAATGEMSVEQRSDDTVVASGTAAGIELTFKARKGPGNKIYMYRSHVDANPYYLKKSSLGALEVANQVVFMFRHASSVLLLCRQMADRVQAVMPGSSVSMNSGWNDADGLIGFEVGMAHMRFSCYIEYGDVVEGAHDDAYPFAIGITLAFDGLTAFRNAMSVVDIDIDAVVDMVRSSYARHAPHAR